MMQIKRYGLLHGICLAVCILLFCSTASAQPIVKKYLVRDGRMVIELSRSIPEKELDQFIRDYDLSELDLKNVLKNNNADTLRKLGWMIEAQNQGLLVFSKPLFSFDMLGSPIDRIIFGKHPVTDDLIPPGNTNFRFGQNKFRKYDFSTQDSVVIFFLRNNKQAKKVELAGSFTNWQNAAIQMRLTDSGWIAAVPLAAGKHWYKFIVDGRWITDPENIQNENDGKGNTNSVYYKTNQRFILDGFTNAKRVYLAGSFNDWRQKELPMQKTASGWELPLMLQEGTHTYKFIVDGNWMADTRNPQRLPDGHGAFNSVIRLGKTHVFRLNGYQNAKQVALAGSFNGWKEDELFLNKTADGWELPYVISNGNHEYKFIVDHKWISDPANPLRGADDNSFLVISPNYTFRINAPEAKAVFLAGDFNGWNPNSLPMKKDGDSWIFSLHLQPGKHRYKFIVDGKWLLDPANKLWEQNEYHTGNSIVWMGQ